MVLGAGWDSGEKLKQCMVCREDQSLHCCPPSKGLRRDILRTVGFTKDVVPRHAPIDVLPPQQATGKSY